MQIINLTPHTMNFPTLGKSIPSSGEARVTQQSAQVGEVDGIPLSTVTFGGVSGLPEPQANTIFIVSAMVRAAVPNRKDVASPGDLVRNEAGQPIGCKSLIINS